MRRGPLYEKNSGEFHTPLDTCDGHTDGPLPAGVNTGWPLGAKTGATIWYHRMSLVRVSIQRQYGARPTGKSVGNTGH